MSFAPTKDKSSTLPGKKMKDGYMGSYRKQDDSGNQDPSVNDKDETMSKNNRSMRSGAEGGIHERLVHIENDVSTIQQQQDMFRQFLSLKETVETLQKDQKTMQASINRASRIEEKLEEFEQRFDEYQHKTEQFLVVLDRNIDEQATIREDENKKIKKVLTELGRRQKEMDYEIKMDVRNNETKAKQDLLSVASDLDRKTDANKEFLQNHIDAVHRALKSSIIDSEDRVDKLTFQLDNASGVLDNRVKKMESTAMPSIDSANKRRKIDHDDLKVWLLDTIDQRLKNNEKKLEDTVKKNYKSTVVQQKSEISNLKREISALSGASPTKNFRESNAMISETQFNEESEEFDGNNQRNSEVENVESRLASKPIP